MWWDCYAVAQIQHQQHHERPGDAAEAARLEHSALLGPRRWLFGAALLAFALSLFFNPYVDVSAFYLAREDRWLLLGGAGLMVAVSIRLRGRDAPLAAGIRLPLVVAATLFLACLAGHYWVLAGYDQSRDEQMATFDAAVFASGRLVQPIPTLWRDHAGALNTLYMYPAEHQGAWISSYLPLNAALRALAGFIATPALTGPLMTVIGALALWGCARRIWPQDREAPVVALLLYTASGQVIVTGMTAYAMPAHLALNLTWLWLFLRRAWWADAAALAVGFVAVGLHQPLMHPMFAAPVLSLLLLEKQWRRAAVYALGYAAIGIFWLWWPSWTWTLVQATAGAQQPQGVDYFTRLAMTVLRGDRNLPYMLVNLLRFVAWQHILLLPLLVLSLKIARKDRLAGALAAGVLLTTFVMAVILPFQGHGFGYRYLHGLIGNCILLAVYGWKSLGARQGTWRALLLRTSIAGIVVLVPLQLWMAHGLYASAAEVSARIEASDADYAVVGEEDVSFAFNLVHNPPLLDRRPVRLARGAVDPTLARLICANHASVALIGDGVLEPIAAYYGASQMTTADDANRAFAPMLARAGCRVIFLG